MQISGANYVTISNIRTQTVKVESDKGILNKKSLRKKIKAT